MGQKSSFTQSPYPVPRFLTGNMKNRILLENSFLPADLERQIGAFVDHYNHHRYHEPLGNLTPADVYFGKVQPIIETRRRIKQDTM